MVLLETMTVKTLNDYWLKTANLLEDLDGHVKVVVFQGQSLSSQMESYDCSMYHG